MTRTRYFKIKDINCVVIVEYETRKNLLDCMRDYIDNFNYEWFDNSEDSFEILYKDGSEDFIDQCYDGHKIKKQHISAIVYSNASSYMVYGNFEMNEYGCITTAFEEKIDASNIEETENIA